MPKDPTQFETTFETYSVEAKIGEGGSGRVFRVTDSSGDAFALKLLKPDTVNSERRRRFKNEIAFCSKASHRNVVRVVATGVVDVGSVKCPFYVMPYFPRTLRRAMADGIPHDEVLKIFSVMLDGVEAAHLQRVWHRDLKPENVLLGQGQDLVIADFGIAHFAEEMLATAVLTRQQEKLLNVEYAAPEQRRKGAQVDHRADIFALGLILNEMYTGAVPQGTNFVQVAQVAPDFAYVDDLVHQMVAQDPATRPSAIDDVKRRLIGLGNLFVAQQELKAAAGKVARRHSPDEVESPTIAGVDYQNGVLDLRLDHRPPNDWLEAFRRPEFSYSSVLGRKPQSFTFEGNVASVRSSEHEAQDIINHFKAWLPLVTEQVRASRIRTAAEAERREAARLKEEQETAARRAELLGKLTF